jgi:Zn-finger nucleic acid-binding protein
MRLTCVKCTSVLDRTRIDDVEVDHCPRCGGLWLDHGETERIAKKMAADVDRLKRLLAARPGPPPIPTELAVHCPACTGDLRELPLGGIHIDYCTRCKGVFLDRGELDATLAALGDQKITLAQLFAAAAESASG